MRIACFAIALLSTLSGHRAEAQQLVQRSFSAQLFEPAIGIDTLLTLETAKVAPHLAFDVDFVVNFQSKPLVLTVQRFNGPSGLPTDPEKVALVKNQVTSDLSFAIGLRRGWFAGQVGIGLPINFAVNGERLDAQGVLTDEGTDFALGDVRLQLKLRLLKNKRGFAVAFSPIVTFPTGCLMAGDGGCEADGRFSGDRSVSFRPRVVADWSAGHLRLAANLGWLFRKDSQVLGATVGDRLLYGVGADYRVHRRASVMLELFGRVGFNSDSTCRNTAGASVCGDKGAANVESFPMEVAFAGRYQATRGVHVTAGAGIGIVRGIGAPAYRLIAGLRWSPDYTDTDNDGIYDDVDRCPTRAEDKDGHLDTDGCPELDNDGDLIPDSRDKCPNQPEDKDTFQDDDGCPDPDNDGDGIPDIQDRCPFKAENKNGIDDDDGCPDIRDKDKDLIADDKDRCPEKPETRNGFEDDDGCPDDDKVDVSVTASEIVFKKRLRFRRQKPAKRSIALLDQLVALLKARKELSVRIAARGGNGYSNRTWRARVEAIRDHLKQGGIAEGRLETMGPRQGAKDLPKKYSGKVIFLLKK